MLSNAIPQGTKREPVGSPVQVDFDARPMIDVVGFCGARASSIDVAARQAKHSGGA